MFLRAKRPHFARARQRAGVVWLAAIRAGLAGTDTVKRLYQALALLLTMVAVAATVIRILAPARVRPAPN